MKFIIIIILFFLIFLFSCEDIISNAKIKNPANTPELVLDLTAETVTNGISLSWTNPSNNTFKQVQILRKLKNYPISPIDPTAIIVYTGSDSTYNDTDTENNTTYYYSVYSISTTGVYSAKSIKIKQTTTSFTTEIRKRSFYLIGGISYYNTTGNPFNYLISQIDAFDPVTETVYANIATLPIPRYSCAISSTNGKIFVFGGLDKNQHVVEEVDILDVLSPNWPDDVWMKAKNMPTPRYSLNAENIEGNLYIFGGATDYSIPFPSMKNINHKYDPTTDNWITDESKVPYLESLFMNFHSGVYDGTLIYGNGRNNVTNGNFTARIYFSNIFAPNSNAAFYEDYVAYAECASVFYHNTKADNTDILAYFILGGCIDSGTDYEPLKTIAGALLRTTSNCYYLTIPADTVLVVDTGQTLNTGRAYAEAEYYGDYVYIFCGLQNNSTGVLSSYERLDVIDGAGDFDLSTPWVQVDATGLQARYAFDTTRLFY